MESFIENEIGNDVELTNISILENGQYTPGLLGVYRGFRSSDTLGAMRARHDPTPVHSSNGEFSNGTTLFDRKRESQDPARIEPASNSTSLSNGCTHARREYDADVVTNVHRRYRLLYRIYTQYTPPKGCRERLTGLSQNVLFA